MRDSILSDDIFSQPNSVRLTSYMRGHAGMTSLFLVTSTALMWGRGSFCEGTESHAMRDRCTGWPRRNHGRLSGTAPHRQRIKECGVDDDPAEFLIKPLDCIVACGLWHSDRT